MSWKKCASGSRKLRADPIATPADVEREVAEEMAQAEAELNGEFINRQNGANGTESATCPPPRSSPETEAEVLRLYRELAKRHHPDLARTRPSASAAPSSCCASTLRIAIAIWLPCSRSISRCSSIRHFP